MKNIFKTLQNFCKKSKKGEEKAEEQKSIRELFPKDFLASALLHYVVISYCNESKYEYEEGGWKVVNCYFAGATLCLDVESKDMADTITICSNDTFGFFVHSNIYKRSNLSPKEIERVNIIRDIRKENSLKQLEEITK